MTGRRAEATGEGRTGAVVRSALVWNLAQHGLTQLVSLAVFLFLAARLEPAVFGLFALAAILVDAVATEARSAFADLLVVRRDFSQRALSTALFAGLAGAGLAYLLLLALGAQIAAVLQAPGLGPVAAVLGLGMLLAPPLAVCEALLLKDLRFRALAARNMAATVFSAGPAVWVVLAGPAEWALVAQRLAAVLFGFVLLALITRWRPGAHFDAVFARGLIGPFAKLWAGQMINFGLGRLPDLLIGARLGPSALGVYRVAARLVETVQSAVSAPLAGVFVPVLAQFGRDLARQAAQYRQIVALSALMTAPALAGLAMLAPDLVTLVLRPQYAEAGVLVAVLACAGLAAPFAHFRGGVLIALGRPGLAAGLALLDLAVTGAAVWIGAGFGLAPAALGVLAASLAAALVSAFVVARALGVETGDLLAPCLPPFLAAAVMVAALAGGGALAQDWPPLWRLFAGAGAGAAVFCGHLALFHRAWVLARLSYLRLRREAPVELEG